MRDWPRSAVPPRKSMRVADGQASLIVRTDGQCWWRPLEPSLSAIYRILLGRKAPDLAGELLFSRPRLVALACRDP